MRWLRHWAPAILWAAAIWTFSTGAFTSENTSRFLLPMLKWLLPGASAATLLLLHSLIRKAAHVAEYFVFSLLALRGVRGEERGWRVTWGLAAIVIVLCYAALDEVHQLLVPGRGASPWDVLLDGFGAVLAQAVAAWRVRRAELEITLADETGKR